MCDGVVDLTEDLHLLPVNFSTQESKEETQPLARQLSDKLTVRNANRELNPNMNGEFVCARLTYAYIQMHKLLCVQKHPPSSARGRRGNYFGGQF